MGKPEYPTQEGNWSKGSRPEKDYSGVKWGTPYPEAVDNFRKAVHGRDDFDPAVLFVWGTMQAKAVLNILKAVEAAFGEQGQEVVRRAVSKAGYEAAEGLLANSSLPDDLEPIELVSFIVTGINCILYASLERSRIMSSDSCEFDILWCPHQDVYSAFDCRVQRYFVEGMLEAMEHKGLGRFLPQVETLIPAGADCCHFTVKKLPDDDSKHPWHAYSEDLGKKALKRSEGKE